MHRFVKHLILIFLLSLPLAAWSFIKPVRVFIPEMAGLSCIDDFVCIDDLTRLEEAKQLYDDAIDFVQTEVGPIASVPRAVFCSSRKCSRRFGLDGGSYGYAAAYNVGTFGLVISYRGWSEHYVRHELIHHLQNEKLGSVNAWFFKPDWFKEGMAYSLSEDPRNPLPEKLEEYRRKYQSWAVKYNNDQLWRAAEEL